jgi:hypothetical protein
MKKWMLLLLPICLWAQNYYEASGQTKAFTLSAGSKAGWNPSIAVEKTRALPALNAFRVSAASNGLFVHAGAKGVLKLFDVRGRMAATITVEHNGFVALSHGLANGIYAARFEAPGMALRTTRLAVVK